MCRLDNIESVKVVICNLLLVLPYETGIRNHKMTTFWSWLEICAPLFLSCFVFYLSIIFFHTKYGNEWCFKYCDGMRTQ